VIFEKNLRNFTTLWSSDQLNFFNFFAKWGHILGFVEILFGFYFIECSKIKICSIIGDHT
jgi:hypothetical protein